MLRYPAAPITSSLALWLKGVMKAANAANAANAAKLTHVMTVCGVKSQLISGVMAAAL